MFTSDEAFILKAYIKRYVTNIRPKYTYPGELGVNPAFQRIEEVRRSLSINAKRIFVLRGDFITAVGVKNAEQQYGYFGLQEAFDESQYHYLNWADRYGHPSLTIPDNNYDGSAYYAGYICQRAGYLEIFLSSGRFNRFGRNVEGIFPLTKTQTNVVEAYLSLKFMQAYGGNKVVFYDTTPQEDKADSALFFTNQSFSTSKLPRVYTAEVIKEVIDLAYCDLGFTAAKEYIKTNIFPVKPKYCYLGECGFNPGYRSISDIHYPLAPQEKLIWVLRSDFILALGVKNAYKQEYGYIGFENSFSESVYKFINQESRYGHPSLTVSEGDYDGSAFYAGYICQREGYLQVYLVSGRFERKDLTEEETRILEAYIAANFQAAYGNQDIIFDVADSADPTFHTIFFGNGMFAASNPQRRYNCESISNILQSCQSTQYSNQRREHEGAILG